MERGLLFIEKEKESEHVPNSMQARREDDKNWFKNHYILWSFVTGLAGIVAYIFTTFATYAWVDNQFVYRDRTVSEKLSYIIDKQKEQDAKLEKLTYYVMTRKQREE